MLNARNILRIEIRLKLLNEPQLKNQPPTPGLEIIEFHTTDEIMA